MEHNINSLKNYKIEANDGLVGEVKEFYFDDQSWKIRYLIVETGNWLAGRTVLIPFDSLVKEPWKTGLFPVNLTKEQVKNSPDVDTDKPVSRQQDLELYGHYAYQRYGGSGFYAGSSAAAMALANDPIIDERLVKEADPKDKRSDDDIHLRSTAVLTNYHIHALDGDIGHVNDFILDDENGKISYLVVDTQNWFGGKKVLISIQNVKEINWSEHKIFLNIAKDLVEKSILFNEDIYNRN